ncbi:hypothetical protein NY486_19250, partial [Enterobacter hormaechei]|nr:hypothetical protein [Enterobacter hormaechei]
SLGAVVGIGYLTGFAKCDFTEEPGLGGRIGGSPGLDGCDVGAVHAKDQIKTHEILSLELPATLV